MSDRAFRFRPDGGWLAAVRIYADRRLLAILLMGFSSGLPLLLGFSTLSYWLSKVGVDRTTIGLFAAVSTPYAFKFAWAPLLDQLAPPPLFRALGRRRGWALALQGGLAAGILWLGTSDPAAAPGLMALAAVVVATLSASQDIVIDAYRIEVLEAHEQGAGAAATQAGYRFGMLAAGAGALALSDFIAWFWVYAAMAALVGIGALGVLLGPEPAAPARDADEAGPRPPVRERLAAWGERAVVAPLADFLKRPGWLAVLAFVLLYKYGDAVAGTMANPFFNELGFTGLEIGSVTKAFGIAATLVGVFVGGLLVARLGVMTALLVGGLLQAVTNLLFAWLATLGPELWALGLVVGADNLTGGLGSAAFVAYLSGLTNRAFTGTQFALLTSLMAFGRTLLSTGSGWLADQLGWPGFFVATLGLAVPGLLLLWWLTRLQRTVPAVAGAAPER